MVQGTDKLKIDGLAVRMMITRVRLMGSRKDEASLKAAVETAHEFFTRNTEAASDDIQAIFGETGDRS